MKWGDHAPTGTGLPDWDETTDNTSEPCGHRLSGGMPPVWALLRAGTPGRCVTCIGRADTASEKPGSASAQTAHASRHPISAHSSSDDSDSRYWFHFTMLFSELEKVLPKLTDRLTSTKISNPGIAHCAERERESRERSRGTRDGAPPEARQSAQSARTIRSSSAPWKALRLPYCERVVHSRLSSGRRGCPCASRRGLKRAQRAARD